MAISDGVSGSIIEQLKKYCIVHICWYNFGRLERARDAIHDDDDKKI